MTGSDHVMLFHGETREHVLPWEGAWPPWERLVLMVGIESGAMSLSRLTLAEMRSIQPDVDEVFTLREYTRDTYSRLPEDIALDPDAHVFRAARYVRSP